MNPAAISPADTHKARKAYALTIKIVLSWGGSSGSLLSYF